MSARPFSTNETGKRSHDTWKYTASDRSCHACCIAFVIVLVFCDTWAKGESGSKSNSWIHGTSACPPTSITFFVASKTVGSAGDIVIFTDRCCFHTVVQSYRVMETPHVRVSTEGLQIIWVAKLCISNWFSTRLQFSDQQEARLDLLFSNYVLMSKEFSVSFSVSLLWKSSIFFRITSMSTVLC